MAGFSWTGEDGTTLQVALQAGEIVIRHSDFPGQPLYWKDGQLRKRGLKAPIELSGAGRDFITTCLARLAAAAKPAYFITGELWQPAVEDCVGHRVTSGG